MGLEDAQQNQGAHNRKLGNVEGLLIIPRILMGGQQAHNVAWGGKEGFLEEVIFQLSLEKENQISVTIKMWK